MPMNLRTSVLLQVLSCLSIWGIEGKKCFKYAFKTMLIEELRTDTPDAHHRLLCASAAV